VENVVHGIDDAKSSYDELKVLKITYHLFPLILNESHCISCKLSRIATTLS